MGLLNRTGAWIAFGAALTAMAAAPAHAHPHAWIDYVVEIRFDSAGDVTGLRQTWLFDEFYTAFATEGFDGDRDGRPDQPRLDQLTAENMRNLAEYGWFTRLTANGTSLSTGTPTEVKTRMTGGRLEASFFLPLRTAVSAHGFDYAIFDPSFYIEMLHARQPDAVQLAGAPADCRHRLVSPTPSAEAVTLAQALDRTETAGDSLGGHFAERVEIRCGD